MGRRISGSANSPSPSMARVWVAASASRKDGERKNCPSSAAAAPPSTIRRAFTRSLFGRLGEVLPEAAPDLDVDQLVAVAGVSSQDALPLPAVVDHGLLRGLIGRRDASVDLVRAELLESLQVGEALGLAADPLAAHALIAHDRAELGRGLPVQAIERSEADGPVDPLDLHRPLAVLGVRVLGLVDRAPDPLRGILRGELALAM